MKAILIESSGKEHRLAIPDDVVVVVWLEHAHGAVEKTFTFNYQEYAKRGYKEPVFTEQKAYILVAK